MAYMVNDAINRGVTHSTGNVIGLMHSDGFFAGNEVLAKVTDAFADSLVDGMCGDLKYGDLEYEAVVNLLHGVRHCRSGQFSHAKLERGWAPPHSTLCPGREDLQAIGVKNLSKLNQFFGKKK